uniref:G-protein coupled receptors family 1 profile domain-containing protein n=1 Tax=Globodera rostochiensis TaxID=31243 RepID=A0A914GSL3_GLORO
MFTGLDRFIAVLFAHWIFNGTKLRLYLAIITTLCTLFSIYHVVAIQLEARTGSYSGVKIPGSIGDIFICKAALALSMSIMALNLLTILIYVLTAIMLRIREGINSATTNSRDRKIFRSLLAIVILNLGGYFCVAIFTVGVMQFTGVIGTPMDFWCAAQLMGLFLNVSASSNGPILLMTRQTL